VSADVDCADARTAIAEAVARVDHGDGVILLTDMVGGTPSNLALANVRPGHVELIAGVNLPMLIKLMQVRCTTSLNETLARTQEAGRKYIKRLGLRPAADTQAARTARRRARPQPPNPTA